MLQLADQPHDALPAILEDEYQTALTVNPLFGRVHPSILWVVAKIFAAAYDKRVKRGGCLFLAHLLRFSCVDQLSLFSGTEVVDVAKISIPNVLKLCLNRKQNGWLWCYDTTLKYLHLLRAAGVLVVRPGEPGIYYLPLGAYALLPDYAGKQVEKLAGKRAKVSCSAAFKRTVLHCTGLGTAQVPDDPWMEETLKQAGLVVDEQAMQRVVQEICATVQSSQGVVLLPTTVAEVAHIVAQHVPHVLKKSDGRFIVRSKEDARQLVAASRFTSDEQSQKQVPGNAVESTAFATHQGAKDLPPGKQDTCEESTACALNLPFQHRVVDSLLTDISITNKNLLSKSNLSEGTEADNLEQESTKLAYSNQMADPSIASRMPAAVAVPPHPLEDTLSLATLLFWRFPQEVQEGLEQTVDIAERLAHLLSDFFEHNASRVPHYLTLLAQDPRALDIAIVDSIVRSYFPDPRHKPDQLGGPWVTKMYKAYRQGQQVEPAILAWANTTYGYDALQTVLAEAARWQVAQGQRPKRPRPEDVVVDSSTSLHNFWNSGAAQGLNGKGYFGVDLEGTLLTCRAYEKLRQYLLFSATGALPPEEYRHEWSTYLDWIRPRICTEEEEAWLLANLPGMFRRYLGKLERALDPERYVLSVQVAPLSHRRVLMVHVRDDPGQAWFLSYGCDVDDFIRWLTEESAGDPSEESTSFFVADERDRR